MTAGEAWPGAPGKAGQSCAGLSPQQHLVLLPPTVLTAAFPCHAPHHLVSLACCVTLPRVPL